MFGISSRLSPAILDEGFDDKGIPILLNKVKHKSECVGKRNIMVHGGVAKRDAPPTVNEDSAVKVHSFKPTDTKSRHTDAHIRNSLNYL